MATRETSDGTRVIYRWTNVAPAGFYSGNPLTLQRALTAAESADLAAMDAGIITANNKASLTDKATQAIAANITFINIASPTNAQVVAQAKAQAKQWNALAKLVLDQLDDTTGT